MADIYQHGFAEIYDRLMLNDYSYAKYADYVERIFSRCRIRPSIVADLGCGTGSLCIELAARGYDMIGIDGSQEMLNVAYAKAMALNAGAAKGNASEAATSEAGTSKGNASEAATSKGNAGEAGTSEAATSNGNASEAGTSKGNASEAATSKSSVLEGGASDARAVQFLNQDISEFELYGTAGAILSTIDSMNYVTDKRRFSRIFTLAANYLEPGGLFIFDLNTRYMLSHVIGGNIFYEISDDVCYIWENRFDGARHISTFDLTFFVRDAGGSYRRFDERHKQRAYSAAEVESSAARSSLRLLGAYANLTFDAPRRNTRKICYVYQKIY
jgi:SAM-dependent methyltransferase